MIDVYQKILQLYETFSSQQQKVADYIVNNIDEAIYFPLSKFVQEIDVSQATIVRFAQHLGYKGFNEFRDSLFEYYRERLSPDNRMKHSIEAMVDGASIYSQIINQEMTYLEKSTFTIDESVLSMAVETLKKCKNIYIFAIGANEYLGFYLKFKLRRLKLSCHLVTDSGREMMENLLLVGSEDAAVVYNFSKPSIDFNRLMQLLSDKKVPSILITDIITPPVIRLATYVLYAERGPEGTFQSPIVPMAITNTLFLRVAEKMEGKAIKAMAELGELRDNYYYNEKFKY